MIIFNFSNWINVFHPKEWLRRETKKTLKRKFVEEEKRKFPNSELVIFTVIRRASDTWQVGGECPWHSNPAIIGTLITGRHQNSGQDLVKKNGKNLKLCGCFFTLACYPIIVFALVTQFEWFLLHRKAAVAAILFPWAPLCTLWQPAGAWVNENMFSLMH